MNRLDLVEPDGRALWLYSRLPIRSGAAAPMPVGDVSAPNPHLRWHPLRGEWIAYAGHRQNRTFLPPPEYDPLAPTIDDRNPTEVPAAPWDVAVFENRFPTLYRGAHDPPNTIVPTEAARGQCEVIVYTQSSTGSLGSLPLWHVEMVVQVWADRTRALTKRDDVSYVMPFENRGVEVGVTLPHPHGQLYAYPFVPPIAARELALQRAHWEREGVGLLGALLGRELAEQTRIVHEEETAVALVPAFARYACEVWIAPKRAAASLVDLDDAELRDFARTLKAMLMKAPTDGKSHPEAHVHVEIFPALRMSGRLEYLAGSELRGIEVDLA